MTKPLAVNLIYTPHKGPPVQHYKGEDGEVWLSSMRDPNKHNITTSWHSLKNPKDTDSIWIMEPRCVNPSDYKPNFLKNFKYIFTWADKAILQYPELKNKLVSFNHPSIKGTPSPNAVEKNILPWNAKKNQIVFVASNKKSNHPSEIYTLRVKLADWLHRNSKYDVHWYGQIPLKKPYYKGKINDKSLAIKNAKFSICTENCYDEIFSHNYFTEKMPEVLFSASVPIYMGCYNIDSFGFDKNLYIDLRKYVKKNGTRTDVNFEGLKNHIESYNENNYNAYLTALKAELRRKNGIFHIISYERVYKKILETFKKKD